MSQLTNLIECCSPSLESSFKCVSLYADDNLLKIICVVHLYTTSDFDSFALLPPSQILQKLNSPHILSQAQTEYRDRRKTVKEVKEKKFDFYKYQSIFPSYKICSFCSSFLLSRFLKMGTLLSVPLNKRLMFF